MPPTEHSFRQRLPRFFAAFDAGEFSPEELSAGHREIVTAPNLPIHGIRDSDKIGIYYFVDDQDDVLYIGSATVAFGYRFWSHYGKIKDPNNWPQWQHASCFQPLVFIGPVTEAKKRYIQALEAYLIATLDPPLNQKV